MTITAILCDQREPDWVQQLTFAGTPTTVTLLDYGDLWATCEDGTLIAIERKTPDDLLNTLKEDRLFPQLAGLIGITRWAYLLITGQLARGADGKVVTDRGATGWSWAAIQGALLTAQELGVFVTYAGSDQDYEAAVLRLGNRRHDTEHLVAPAKVARIFAPGEQALLGLPGIGPEKVPTLLDWCGSPANALAYLTDMQFEPDAPGIGKVTKQNVRRALGLEPWAELAIIPTADKPQGENGHNG